MSGKFPKVLILGQYFDKKSGSGITLTNLFKSWHKNNIAVAAADIYNPDFSVCEKFYRIGDKEIIRGFPFNLKFHAESSKSGIVINDNIKRTAKEFIPQQTSKIESFKDQLLFVTGQIHRRRKFQASKDFLSWVNEFSPDIIYTQLSSYELIRFVSEMHLLLGKPLIVHMMDDWPETITTKQKGIFKSFWSYHINGELLQIFKKSALLLSISEAMSEEYLVRYNYNFLPFHNPIDIINWTSGFKKDYSRKDNFVILYAGRVGTGLQNCLIEIALAIKSLISKGFNIEFHIQATNANFILDELGKFDFVTIKGLAEYNELPDIFTSADLLLLPNDFDNKAISFLKYSMPTKASEYMVSGTPILLYSSSETAITNHALKHDWAFVVSENSKDKIETAISELYENEALRMTIGKKAKEFAIQNYDSEKVRADFKKAIIMHC